MKIKFIVEGKGPREVDARPGMTLMAATRAHDFRLEAACGGAMACATCHVVVAEAWVDRLVPPGPEEESVLDVVFGVGERSRLACQIRLTDALDGLEVHVPLPLSAPLS